MAVSAKIKFTQGALNPVPGLALIGVVTTPVVVTNGDNSNVAIFTWEVIDKPPTSAVPTGVVAVGAVPSYSFTPDQPGGYLIHLTVVDLAGNRAEDFRVFQVPEPSGHIIPPFDALAPALNFGGQTRGWAKYQEELLRFLLDDAVAGVVTTADATPTLAFRFPAADGYVIPVRAIVKVRSTDLSAAVLGEWEVKASYKRVAGTLSAAFAATITELFKVGVPGAPTLTLNGNTDVDLNVTGIAATALTWTVSEFTF